MVRRVTIKNFKSIEDLSIDLGRCTVFIGANGSGKSNILEAIALASAAAADKLDNEYLASRGIRIMDTAAHITSAFDTSAIDHPIAIDYYYSNNDSTSQETEEKHLLQIKQNGSYVNWTDISHTVQPLAISLNKLRDVIRKMEASANKGISTLEAVPIDQVENEARINRLQHVAAQVADAYSAINSIEHKVKSRHNSFKDFIIYSPVVKSLRTFESEGQILPLGIRGEGLFRLLKSILAQKDETRVQQIKASLKVIDWFSDFSLADNLMSSEYSLQIRDRYLADDLAVFDQRSTNEGFLYLLFYFTLFCAEETPKFFAIDNIDDSLNPRLSAETIKNLVQIAKEHDKQFLATTHQPGLLDGLNLSDPEQILYIVFRNLEGRTSVRRVQPPKTNGSEPVRLSEAFIRGYLGGLPNHF